MNIKSHLTIGNMRKWIGFVAQAAAGLPPVYVAMDHVRASAWKGLLRGFAYNESVVIFILEASVALVTSIILLGVGRLVLRQWHRGLFIMNSTLYGMVLIQGITIEFAARNLRDCGRTIC